MNCWEFPGSGRKPFHSQDFPRIPQNFVSVPIYSRDSGMLVQISAGKNISGNSRTFFSGVLEKSQDFLQKFRTKIISAFENMSPGSESYNFGQNCWENCILGQHFYKHRSCTGSSLSPFPWKQCCCVFKRKPYPWAFVESNIELGEGVFFPQRCRFGNSFVAQESGHDGENFLK